jgi:hypothetical protein
MTFAEHAFLACAAKAKEVGRRLNKDEWMETMQGAYDSYPHGGLLVSDSPKPKKPLPKANDEDWLKELEANPAYRGIDIRRELGKAQAWASVRGVGVSQRRFINWLNKAMTDRPLAMVGSNFSPRPQQPQSEPTGWREWVRENSTDPSNADKPWSALDPAAQKYIISQLNVTPTVHPARPRPSPILDREEVPDEDIPVARQKDAGTLLVGNLLQGYRQTLRH